jgi:Concanavalin A-like lectin/glucanases superfamily
MRIARGRRGAGSSRITPSTIFGAALIGWYEYTRVVLGTGSEVATAVDSSPKGNAVSQGTASRRPVLASTGIVFDGTDDRLESLSNAGMDSGTLLVVGMRVRPDVVTGNGVPVCRSQSGSGSWSVQTSSAGLRMHIGTPGVSFGEVASALSAGTERTYVWAYDGGGATNADRLKLWIDGVAQTVSFTGTIPVTISNTANGFFLGSFANAAQFWDGSIKAITIANSALTAAQRALLEAYLGSL